MSSVTALLLKHLQVKSRSGMEWLCLCPYHEDTSPSFSVNIRKKLFICYACGAKGNMNQLLTHLGVGGESVHDEETSLEELVQKIRKAEEQVSQTERPNVGVPVNHRFYSDAKKIQGYWADQRGISLNAIAGYKLGYDPLTDQAIIPIQDYETGLTVGLIRRNTGSAVDGGSPRYLYSKGMKISENVFGSWQAKNFRNFYNTHGTKFKPVLVITEGSVDAMSIHKLQSSSTQRVYVGVAILGSRISKQQALIIKALGFEEVIIATDMDRAGKLAQIQVATMLQDVRCGALVYKASWPLEEGKDLNELTSSARCSYLDKAISKSVVHDYINSQIQRPPAGTQTSTTSNGMYKVTYKSPWHNPRSNSPLNK